MQCDSGSGLRTPPSPGHFQGGSLARLGGAGSRWETQFSPHGSSPTVCWSVLPAWGRASFPQSKLSKREATLSMSRPWRSWGSISSHLVVRSEALGTAHIWADGLYFTFKGRRPKYLWTCLKTIIETERRKESLWGLCVPSEPITPPPSLTQTGARRP